MHLHELQNEIKKTDREQEPEKYRLLEEYIEQGGYKSPAEAEDSSEKITNITSKKFKIFLFIAASISLVNGFYLLSLTFNPVMIIGFGLNVGLIWSLATDHRASKTIVITLGAIIFISVLASLVAIYYSTEVKSEMVADIAFRFILSAAMLLGAKKYMKIVPATSNK